MSMHVRATLLVVTFVAGCAPEATFPALHPLSGTVTRDGKPVTAGGLIFIPESGNWAGNVVNASVNRDGTFTVDTSRILKDETAIRPGAPLGTFKVMYHPPGSGEKVGLEVEIVERVRVEAKENVVSLVVPGKEPGVAK